MPVREYTNPIRISMNDIFVSSAEGQIGSIEEGRIECEVVTDNEPLILMPGKLLRNLKSMQVNGTLRKQAVAGDSVEMSINFPKGFDYTILKPGMMLCAPKYLSYPDYEFRAEITSFELKYPIIKGKSIYMHTHF